MKLNIVNSFDDYESIIRMPKLLEIQDRSHFNWKRWF